MVHSDFILINAVTLNTKHHHRRSTFKKIQCAGVVLGNQASVNWCIAALLKLVLDGTHVDNKWFFNTEITIKAIKRNIHNRKKRKTIFITAQQCVMTWHISFLHSRFLVIIHL